MAFTLHTEIAYAPRDGVAIEHEVFSYFDALHAASVPGGSALADFDEWTDRRYSSDDARALVSELEQARELISAAFARDIDTVPEPPERVGFDESEEGAPFGRDGFLTLLNEIIAVFRRASEAGVQVFAKGD